MDKDDIYFLVGTVLALLAFFGIDWKGIKQKVPMLQPKWRAGLLVFCILGSLAMSGMGWYKCLHSRPISNYELDQQWGRYRYQEVWNRTYKDETVLLDGYQYRNVNFEHVTFVYNGTAPLSLKNCNFIGGTFRVRGGSPATKAAIMLMSEIFKVTGSPPTGIDYAPWDR
jgi:hypothetical protein